MGAYLSGCGDRGGDIWICGHYGCRGGDREAAVLSVSGAIPGVAGQRIGAKDVAES
jgi:hypothetical protein